MGSLVIAAIRQHESDLESGALVVIDESKNRIRILPQPVTAELALRFGRALASSSILAQLAGDL